MIDSHCHLDFDHFDSDLDSVVDRSCSLGVEKFIIPGVDPQSWQRAQKICQEKSPCYFSVGLHPWMLEKNVASKAIVDAEQEFFSSTSDYLTDDKCVAVGECGFDKLIRTDIEIQQRVFEWHVTLANQNQLPLIIHCVKHHQKLQIQLKNKNVFSGGVIHAFSGSYELAKQYVDLGFYLGVGGTITYQRANKTRDAIKRIPLEVLVLETDAPDMPVCGRQGQRNSPEYLPEIAQALAEIKNENIDKVESQTSENCQRLFGFI